jgi:RHS repeat-associated protein
MAGISSKASGKIENKMKFNDGTELNNDFDLSLYETPFRGYDPQIGRFWQIDPLADDFFENSPFVFSNNNPVLLNDPTGLFADSVKNKSGEWVYFDNQDLVEVVVRPSVKHMNAWQKDMFYARNLTYNLETGGYDLNNNSNYDAVTQNFLDSYHRMVQKEHEFDKAVGGFVQEGILFAVPWGRVIKGASWAYKATKLNQVLKVSNSGKVFWSGGPVAREAAEAFAKANAIKTLDITNIVKAL